MERVNMRLPACLAAGFVFGPEFSTKIVPFSNGAESRNRDWLYGRWRGIGNYNAFSEEDQDAIDSVYQVVAGRWAAFRVRDTSRRSRWYVDGEALSPEIGTNNPVQVIRTYEWGGFTTERMIQALDPTDFVLKRNGTEISDYTLDDELGILVPDTTWAVGTYTWTGPHDLWMRFNSDWGASSVIAQRITSGEIELIEDRQYSEGSSS